ncbi:hypothetical protein M9H77_28210 [Catharanthus roseus]|uniref:Uncharacterized protein n=1 Tax=Catharanthus roseus TaxID=4058 RepID=A0ACC0AHD3_CATRO|nr:hypothetical protein M9H77_28210 [Catharanthus roseus]
MIEPQPIWNRLLGCLFDRVLGMPRRLLLSSSEPSLNSLCLLESSRLLVSPPDPSALPLLFSLGSGVLCFSIVHRPSVSPCLSVSEREREIERERERERDRGRRLPVIPSRLRPCRYSASVFWLGNHTCFVIVIRSCFSNKWYQSRGSGSSASTSDSNLSDLRSFSDPASEFIWLAAGFLFTAYRLAASFIFCLCVSSCSRLLFSCFWISSFGLLPVLFVGCDGFLPILLLLLRLLLHFCFWFFPLVYYSSFSFCFSQKKNQNPSLA